jgi:hypothetical protein
MLMVAGCATPASAPASDLTDLHPIGVAQGTYSGEDGPANVEVRLLDNADDLHTFWTRHHPTQPGGLRSNEPAVDHDRQAVLVALWNGPDTASSVTITAVHQKDGIYVVDVDQHVSCACNAGQAFTPSLHAVRVDRIPILGADPWPPVRAITHLVPCSQGATQ